MLICLLFNDDSLLGLPSLFLIPQLSSYLAHACAPLRGRSFLLRPLQGCRRQVGEEEEDRHQLGEEEAHPFQEVGCKVLVQKREEEKKAICGPTSALAC